MSEPSLIEFAYDCRVPFYDVDSMNIAWHGHYVKYFEQARCAWLEWIDYDYVQMHTDGFAWPVAQLHIKYIRPATFGQHLRVWVSLREYESCLKLDYRITDRDSGEVLTKGMTMQIAVRIADQETQFQTPPSWQQKIRARMGRES
ncbi:acyl-CoA thioesterase [Suttonella sp. R2A3]|uniref:acyl-CoA thioesterase n=1 Tax=Suttonella sp. R2A3 TaxID=2908648 RepID=UPI001F2D81B6|nr:thioesterase family protein [Suttonella sp. R2A3]UJF23667.1 acyl-CoA thioesterase [Suttonella sp. R2A3]